MDYDILIKFLLSAALGGLIGLEREYQNKSAGFRTLILISVGSCMFTTLSILIGGPENADRIASNIITGIGFLGAGVIFRGENRVIGITTAASIWVVAAIGMSVGAGYYIIATIASVLIVAVLAFLYYIERRIDEANKMKTYTIAYLWNETVFRDFEKQFRDHGLKCKSIKQIKKKESMTGTWEAYGKSANHEAFIAAVLRDQRVECFEF